MKKRLIALLLVGASVIAAGCTTTVETTISSETTTEITSEATSETTIETSSSDYHDSYKTVIDQIEQFIKADTTDENADGMTGFVEVKYEYGASDVLKKVGYVYKDLNSDGTDELIFAINDQDNGSRILAIYSIVNGDVKQVLEGWHRNVYSILKDGNLFSESSGGAFDSQMSVFVYKGDAEFDTVDLCFTQKTEDGNIRYYHNNFGEFDPANSAELSQDEYFAESDSFNANKQTLDLTFLTK